MKEVATRWNYVWQLSMAGVFIFCVLLLFKNMALKDDLWALGLSSLASSTFIIFAMPKAEAAQDHRVISAYFTNMAVGGLTHFCLIYLLGHDAMFLGHGFYVFSFVAALAVSLSLFLMVILNIKHPPALGICIILIINMHRYDIMAVIAFSALVLALLHFSLKRWMRTL